MKKREVYHVVYDRKSEDWRVEKEKAQRAFAAGIDTKEKAIKIARREAKAADLGQIKIHLKRGPIQREHTYGDDPPKYAS
jgi:23S rRNA G2445 N2-methylase RlmL